jgi:hypothetical protein
VPQLGDQTTDDVPKNDSIASTSAFFPDVHTEYARSRHGVSDAARWWRPDSSVLQLPGPAAAPFHHQEPPASPSCCASGGEWTCITLLEMCVLLPAVFCTSFKLAVSPLCKVGAGEPYQAVTETGAVAATHCISGILACFTYHLKKFGGPEHGVHDELCFV